jgi:hypothetical protein
VGAPNIVAILTTYQSIGAPGRADHAVEATLQLPVWDPLRFPRNMDMKLARGLKIEAFLLRPLDIGIHLRCIRDA